MKPTRIQPTDTDFPGALTTIPSPPKQLFVLGNLAPLLERPRVAVVGSRKITPYGRAVTEQLVCELVKAGVVIVSGLALGTDSVAHKACLQVGGQTIAVLPSSLGAIYPSSHRGLAAEILKRGGALVSEYPAGTEAFPGNFVARNRIVSGISDGVLIIEAADKSGTLHTANFALDQGKTVFAVPGNITSPTSQGTNKLLKSGALLVTEADDILSALQIGITDKQRQLPLAANQAEHVIITIIADGTTETSAILALSDLEPSEFNQTLSMLEITGKIRPTGAGHWSIY